MLEVVEMTGNIYKKWVKLIWILRSSHQRCSLKKGALKNFSMFTGKHLCWSPFFSNCITVFPERLSEILKMVFDYMKRLPFSQFNYLL